MILASNLEDLELIHSPQMLLVRELRHMKKENIEYVK